MSGAALWRAPCAHTHTHTHTHTSLHSVCVCVCDSSEHALLSTVCSFSLSRSCAHACTLLSSFQARLSLPLRLNVPDSQQLIRGDGHFVSLSVGSLGPQQ